MRDVLDDIERWRAEGRPVAIATVVETWGSAPRPAGGKMAIASGGAIAGSVSGGCVENAVVEAAAETLATGRPKLLKFGVSDDTAWSVGLACGGSIEVFVERLAPATFDPVRDALRGERPIATATVLSGASAGHKAVVPDDGTASGSPEEALRAAARRGLAARAGSRVPTAEGEIFVEVLLPSPRLVIVGGVHIALALVTFAKALGYRAILVDPREAFGNPRRFPHADEILSEWPDQALARVGINASTAVAVLTHDPKLDDPALLSALRSSAFYVGALGSKRTQEKRRKRLLEAGVTEEELARLRGPIGLPLGGRSPEEIALAIMAQIVETRCHPEGNARGTPFVVAP